MKKPVLQVILKLFFILIISAGIYLFSFFLTYLKYGWKIFPTNHLSNSISYNGNLQNLLEKRNLKEIKFLVIGSSLSLNDISAKTIEDSFKMPTYNIASWGFRSNDIKSFFENIPVNNCKYVLVAFNNLDFGPGEADYNFTFTNQFIYGNSFERAFLFLKKFSNRSFKEDLDFRLRYLYKSNDYGSMDYDKYGSVLLDSTGFVFSKKRYYDYHDTTGFNFFFMNTRDLKNQLDKKGIHLILLYLPWRQDLITSKRRSENDFVSQKIRTEFGNYFIDEHNIKIDSSFYCDAAHLFNYGAKEITNNLIDSVKSKMLVQ